LPKNPLSTAARKYLILWGWKLADIGAHKQMFLGGFSRTAQTGALLPEHSEAGTLCDSDCPKGGAKSPTTFAPRVCGFLQVSLRCGRNRCLTLGHRAISSTMVHVSTSDSQASEAAAEAMMAMY